MRVCVLAHLYPNREQPTKGLFVRDHVRALRAAGVGAEVISPVPWVPWWLAWWGRRWRALRAIPGCDESEDGLVRCPRFFTLPNAYWRSREGASIARAVAPLLAGASFDLLHAHTAVPDGDAARRLAADLGVPFVCTVHGYDARWLRRRGAVRRAILATFREAAHVVCVSERLRGACLQHHPDPDRFSVIHHGFDLPAERVEPPIALPAGRLVILSVGNLIPQKGFAELLRAYARVRCACPAAYLVIVGAGPERRRLESLSASLGLRGQVSFTGWQPHAAVLALHRRADLFCLASRDEGFGMVYLEAMAHGVPVIGSEGEGISDIIAHGDNGWLVPACESAAMAAAIGRLLGDEPLRRRLGEAGRRLVTEQMTWAHNARQHLALYRQVLGLERP